MPTTYPLSVANVATQLPMTPLSFAPIAVGPGKGILTISIYGTYQGQIEVATCLDDLNFQEVNPTSIAKGSDGTTGISANATGQWTVGVSGVQAFVYLSAYTSGTANVTLTWGNGDSPVGEGSGGTDVNATFTSPLGAHGAVEVEGVTGGTGTPVPVSSSTLATSANQTNGSQVTGINANALAATTKTFQVKIAVTGAEVNGPNLSCVNGVVITSGISNATFTSLAGQVGGVVGPFGVTNAVDGTGTGYPLQPGQGVGFGVTNASDLWFNGVAGDVFFGGVS
jgi:hypothetical protein